MLFGLALIAVPLLAAVLTAVLQIRDLSDTGQKIVIQGVTGARASQALRRRRHCWRTRPTSLRKLPPPRR